MSQPEEDKSIVCEYTDDPDGELAYWAGMGELWEKYLWLQDSGIIFGEAYECRNLSVDSYFDENNFFGGYFHKITSDNPEKAKGELRCRVAQYLRDHRVEILEERIKAKKVEINQLEKRIGNIKIEIEDHKSWLSRKKHILNTILRTRKLEIERTAGSDLRAIDEEPNDWVEVAYVRGDDKNCAQSYHALIDPDDQRRVILIEQHLVLERFGGSVSYGRVTRRSFREVASCKKGRFSIKNAGGYLALRYLNGRVHDSVFFKGDRGDDLGIFAKWWNRT